MVEKEVNKFVKENRNSPKKKRRKSKSSIKNSSTKKQFVDEELLQTLEQKGFKRKTQPQIQEAQQRSSSIRKRRRKTARKTGKTSKKIIELPNLKDKKIQLEFKPEEAKSEKKSLFSGIFNLFKKKSQPYQKVLKAEDKKEEIKPIEKINLETKNEVKPEVKDEIKEEIKAEEIEKTIISVENKEESEIFPVPEVDQKGLSQSEVIAAAKKLEEKNKKVGFFVKLKEKLKKKVKSPEELESITIIPQKDSLNEMHSTSTSYQSPNEGVNIAQTLKQEIMPKRQDNQEKIKEENSPEKTTGDKPAEQSSIDILFSDKKKKIT